MVKSITLANFRRHEFLELEFDEGLNSIVGSENAGKSTVLHAIMYCLFGAQAAGIPVDRLWRRGIDPNETRHVGLEMNDGHTLLRNDNRARVFSPDRGNVIASGQTPVTKWVEDYFGMSKSDLILMMHSPPNETRALLEMGPTGLQAKVEKLAGVDVIDSVLGKLKPDLDRASGALAATGEVDLLLMECKREEIGRGQQDGITLSLAVDSADRKLSMAKEARSQAEQAWVKAVDTDKQCERLRYTLGDANGNWLDASTKLADAKEKLADLHEPDPDRLGLLAFALGEAEEALAAAVKARTERDTVEGLLRGCELWLNQNNMCMKINAARMEDWAAAQNTVAVDQKVLDAAMLKRDAVASAFKEADDYLRTGVCPKCDRPFEHFDRDKAEKAREKALAAKILAQEAFEEARLTYHASVKVEEGLREGIDFDLPKTWEQMSATQVDLLQQMHSMRQVRDDELGDRKGKRDRLNEQLRQAEQDGKDWEGLSKQIGELEDTICSLAEQRALKEIELKGLVERATPVQEAELAMTAARARETEAQAALNLAESELKDAKLWLKTLQKELDSLTEQREKWLEAKAEVDVLTDLQKYLRTSRTRLSQDIWDGLLAYASHLLGLASSGSLNSITRNAKGEFMVDGAPALDQGEAMKAVIGLSLRVAMARTFLGNGLPLLLDEVSANARDGVAAMTAGMLAGLGNQVIAVTHRSGDAVLGKILEVG